MEETIVHTAGPSNSKGSSLNNVSLTLPLISKFEKFQGFPFPSSVVKPKHQPNAKSHSPATIVVPSGGYSSAMSMFTVILCNWPYKRDPLLNPREKTLSSDIAWRLRCSSH